jgi:hypothetical protein
MRILHGTPEAVDRFSAQAEDMLRANFAQFADDKEHVARTKVCGPANAHGQQAPRRTLEPDGVRGCAAPSSHSLLTSDRPLVMTNGISGPGKHLSVPIGPSLLFIAADDPAEVQRLSRHDQDALAMVTNDHVVRQARKFVWGIDACHLRFVERRLGEMLPSSPLEA